MSRRHLLAGPVGAAAAMAALGPSAGPGRSGAAGEARVVVDGRPDWGEVRAQFRMEPGWVNLAMFYLASHPRVVREAVDHLCRQIDANPLSVAEGLSLADGPTGWPRVRAALADYLGARPEQLAMTASTTVGLGVVYNGVRTRPGQEFVLSDNDHFTHVEAARLAADKHGAGVRVCSWFHDPAQATAEEITRAIRNQIRPHTRVLGVTWVQSSTGVRMPVRRIAEVVRQANQGRREADRCLLVVDGVHGLAAVDQDGARLGADILVAGTHKWLFGPRGTGLVWVSPQALDHVRPTFAAFVRGGGASPLSPGGFLAFEHAFALPVSVAFHQSLGRARVADRITELSTRVKQGLARTPGVTLRTPPAPELSAGITCFSVRGHSNEEVVARAAERKVRLSHASNPSRPFPRIGTGIMNTPDDVDTALTAIADIAR
ncbi:aminotransferase class V-fold PLP-dependent enzyme [Streptomyces aurantiacus]|uniref:aminotransferase class V-fold PLP-dependent enzyme n=1 Tax=Streptomyces aurantiacus TaxID=47760 RepID=UPI00332CE6D9